METSSKLYSDLVTLSSMGKKIRDRDRQLRVYDRHLKISLLSFEKNVEAINDPFVEASELLMTKYNIFSQCSELAAKNAGEIQTGFGTVLHQMVKVNKDMFYSYHRLFKELKEHSSETKLKQLQVQLSRRVKAPDVGIKVKTASINFTVRYPNNAWRLPTK